MKWFIFLVCVLMLQSCSPGSFEDFKEGDYVTRNLVGVLESIDPSKIRNLINYRLEHGYRELLDNTHDLTLKLSRPQTKIEYIREFEKLSVNNSDRLEDQKYWISLMGINLYLLSTEIYLEYLTRATNPYKNWLNARIRFLNRNIPDRPNLSSWFILDDA